MDYKQEIKERLEILPETLKAFVTNESWRSEAQKIWQKFGFGQEKYVTFENEIFLVLLCFEPRKDLEENLKNELGMDENTVVQIKDEVSKNIFNAVSSELDEIERQIEENEKEEPNEQPIEEKKPANTVGQSFERIILNQAKAMMPAQPAATPAGGIMNHELGIMGRKEEKPENLPVGESERGAIHNYLPNQDPYREPVE